MTLDPRTLASDVRTEVTHRAIQAEDPYDRARAAERGLRDALAKARARTWRRYHWWGRDAR